MTEMAELKVLLDELGRELQQSKADLGEERKDSRDLRTQLEVCVWLLGRGDRLYHFSSSSYRRRSCLRSSWQTRW